MNQKEAIEKAQLFAQTRYAGEVGNIIREYQLRTVQMRGRLSARGSIMSGNMVHESSEIDGAQIRAMVEARLDAILEGYELYEIPIDDQMAVDICNQVLQQMNQLVQNCGFPSIWSNAPENLRSQYPIMVSQVVGLSASSIKTTIDRRRLMKRKSEGQTTIYNIQGDNARWNTNATDNSMNIVTKSNTEFFATLRETIATGVPEVDEQRAILEKLDALQEANGKPSFGQRYTDFIATAANHMALLGPFIPALTEMLHKALG